MTVPLFDWPDAIRPSREIVLAIGHVRDGFLSRAGLENDVPVPGARNQLRMEFDMVKPSNGHLVAWLYQNARRGWFRVRLHCTPQLASSAAIAAAERAWQAGLPFSTGEYFSTGSGFLFNPTLDVSAAALEGASEIVLDESRWPEALGYGNVIGIGRGVYHVNELSRDGDEITLTISPPLRRAIDAGEYASLRPSLICKPADLKSFLTLFDPNRTITPGALAMNEVIDADYL